jgi:glycosyltransferase involved in cell wall biosynthesis
MPPPRILQIGKHFHPDVGGIETVTKNISDALAGMGWRADVLCMALHGTGDLQEAGYRVIRSRTDAVIAGNKTLSWDYAKQVGSLSALYDVGILHMPNPLGAGAVLAAWRKPLIILWHADFSHSVLEWLTRPLDVAVTRRASAIVAPTRVHLAASNRARHLVAKGDIIPFPLALRPSHGEAPPSELAAQVSRAARGRPIVLAAGRLVSYKGFDILIRAMTLVGEGLYCVIAGDGPLRDQLARQIDEAGLGDRVMMAGRVSDDDMAALIALARFGCLPSISNQEMYGLTQVEMMAAGKPVVSTRLVGSGVPLVNRDGETGLLAEPGDPRSLAERLAVLAGDRPLYDRLAEGAARAFRDEHSFASVGRRWVSLVQRIVGGGRAGRHIQ